MTGEKVAVGLKEDMVGNYAKLLVGIWGQTGIRKISRVFDAFKEGLDRKIRGKWLA